MNDRYPYLLSPAFNFQVACHIHTFGQEWWMKQKEKIMAFACRRAEKSKWRRVAADQKLQDERKLGIKKIAGKFMGSMIWKSLRVMEKHANYECNKKFEKADVRGAVFLVNDLDTMLVVNPSQLALENIADMSWEDQALAKRDALQVLKEGRRSRTLARQFVRKASSEVVPISGGTRTSGTPVAVTDV